MNNSQNSTYIRAIAIVAIIVLAGGSLAYALLGKTPTVASTVATPTSASVTTSMQSAATTSTVATTAASAYKNGTYTSTGSYISPGGDEKIGVTVTLNNDIITSVSVTPEPVSSEGKRYQSIFQQNFQPLVVGKNISDVHLTTVSGSSLTSSGFNQALTSIETEAKA